MKHALRVRINVGSRRAKPFPHTQQDVHSCRESAFEKKKNKKNKMEAQPAPNNAFVHRLRQRDTFVGFKFSAVKNKEYVRTGCVLKEPDIPVVVDCHKTIHRIDDFKRIDIVLYNDTHK